MSEMKVERLTDEERRCGLPKDCNAYQVHAKALRIIDQLTAALEAAEKDRDNWKHWRATAVKACDRCEEREKALQARVAELEHALEGAGDATLDDWARLLGRAEKAESELATAKARVAELEGQRAQLNSYIVQNLGPASSSTLLARAEKAESELADLRGRVERAEEWLTSAWISNAKRVSLAWEALRGR